MKHIRMVGLVAIAAAALMAFVGAGTASAATLKSTGTPLSAPVTIHEESEDWVFILFTDGSTLEECERSTIEGTSTNSETPIIEHIEVFIWENCSFTTDTLTNGSLSISESGSVSGSGSVWTVNPGVTCRYGTGIGTALGKLEGQKLNINAVINEQEPKAFLCPDTTRLVANYKVTSPHALTVG